MRNSMWPPPVYEGTFADGSTLRMSFAQKAGKPIDFARGRRLMGLADRTMRVPAEAFSGKPQWTLKAKLKSALVSGVVYTSAGAAAHVDPMTDTPVKAKKPALAGLVKRLLAELDAGNKTAAAAVAELRAAV